MCTFVFNCHCYSYDLVSISICFILETMLEVCLQGIIYYLFLTTQVKVNWLTIFSKVG